MPARLLVPMHGIGPLQLVPMHGIGPLQLVPMHGIGTRHDLPLPFPFVVAGAAAALVVSFAVLFWAWRTPRLQRLPGRTSAVLTAVANAPSLHWLARAVVLAVYLWVGLALFAGPDLATNPAFGFVFVWMWVGLVPVSLLLGPVWRETNPLRTLHRGLCALARVEPGDGLFRLPGRVGVWPASLGLLAFGWLELVQPDRTTLVVLRVWALAWVVIVLLGAVVFGAGWIAAADPFEAYASTIARAAPLGRADNGQLGLVNPLAHLCAWRPPPGAPVLVSVLLGTTAFDSLTNTSWWISTSQNSSASPLLWGSAGLIAVVLLVMGTYAAATAAMSRFTRVNGPPAGKLPRYLAASVVPIAIGYAVAHYATLLLVEGQRTAILISDPLGRGWNVFGTAGLGVDSGIFNHPAAVATLQVLAIVTGHVVGIVVAHERALRVLAPRKTVAGQLPLLAVMVGYTVAGLLLLFSP